MTEQTLLNNLCLFLHTHSYKEGDFTLSSGKKSSFYFDAKPVLFSHEGLNMFTAWLTYRVDMLGQKINSIGGKELGAVPIAAAMCQTYWPDRLNMFVVRKETKTYGTQKKIEGYVNPGDKVIIVDDVVTTGASILQAADAVTEIGARVVGIYALLDREDESLSPRLAYNKLYKPAFTLSEFRTRREELIGP